MVGALNAGRVRYALAGGVAVSIYASPRATEDVDFPIAGDPDGRSGYIRIASS